MGQALAGDCLIVYKRIKAMPIIEKRIQKDIETINGFNASPGNGITRLTFSPEYQGAVTYVVDEMQKIGADILIGPAGNIRARCLGSGGCGPAVMMGSHLDTVAHGGQFDGVVGVVTALEAARAMAEDQIDHRLELRTPCGGYRQSANLQTGTGECDPGPGQVQCRCPQFR